MFSVTNVYGRCTDGSYVRVRDCDDATHAREYLKSMTAEHVSTDGAWEYWESKEYGWGYRFFDFALVAGN